MSKRKDYGAEGQEGDQAHAEAMKEFGILEFGASHVQETTIDMRMNYVGLFGHWLKLNKYGKYVKTWGLAQGLNKGILFVSL